MAGTTLSARIEAAFDTRNVVEPAAGEIPADRGVAEQQQDGLIARLGPIGAFKLGATIPAIRRDLQLDRFFFGAIPAGRIFADGAAIPYRLCRQRGVESEYGFRFGRDLTEADALNEDTLWAAIDAVIPSIEIPGTRFGELGQYKGLGMIVDNGSVGTLVLGEPVKVDDWKMLRDAKVTLTIDGQEPVVGTGAVIDDGPFGPVPGFVRHALGRGHQIRAGQVVVSGSCTGYVLVEPGRTITSHFSILGRSVSASFSPAAA